MQYGLGRLMPVAEGTLEAYAILGLPVLPGQHLHLRQRVKQLPVKQPVLHFTIEVLYIFVLPLRPKIGALGLFPTLVGHYQASVAIDSDPSSERMCAGTSLSSIRPVSGGGKEGRAGGGLLSIGN